MQIFGKSTSKVGERFLLNPEQDPHFFYKNVKALALLFDQIIIWSPNSERFEESGFDIGDLVTAFTQPINGNTVLIPAGRQRYFTPDKAYAPKDPTFRRILQKEAETQSTILTLDARADFYDMMRLIQKEHSRRYQPVIEQVSRNFNTRTLNPANAQRVREFSRKEKVSFAASHVAEFLMEARVCTDLFKAHPRRPIRHLVDSIGAESYSLLSELGPSLRAVDSSKQDPPYDPLGLLVEDLRRDRLVIEQVSKIFGAQEMSWKELMETKKEFGLDIKEVYRILFSDENTARRVPAEVDLKIAHLRLLRKVLKEGAGAIRKVALKSAFGDYDSFMADVTNATRAIEHDIDEANKFGRSAIEYAGATIGGKLGNVIFDAGKYYMGIDSLFAKVIMDTTFRFSAINRIALYAASSPST